jgi:hypothetical protein
MVEQALSLQLIYDTLVFAIWFRLLSAAANKTAYIVEKQPSLRYTPTERQFSHPVTLEIFGKRFQYLCYKQ